MITHLEKDHKNQLPSVVCLGFFDGVHLGHQAIILHGKKLSVEHSLLLCVHTYDVPPERLLKQGEPALELTGSADKEALLDALGVDVVAVSHFDQAMMKMRGKDFFEEVLVSRLNARHIVAGFNHRFGYHGDTGIPELATLCEAAGIALHVVPAVTTAGGRIISSTAIRESIRLGEYGLAGEMLGRPVPDSLMPG